jgi:putative hydrolase of the HAD superfamily
MPLSPRWIAFDAVGTLIFADPPVHLAYYRVGKRHGSQRRPQEVRARFRDAFAARAPGAPPDVDAVGNAVTSQKLPAAGTACTEQTERTFWRSVVAEVLDDVHDREACFEELFAHFAQPQSWQPFADVEETLDEARRRGIRLAIASNFDARLHTVCAGLPELAPIELRVVSSEIGGRKPEPAFYQGLLAACGCSPAELLMIGDEWEHDVAGPRRQGIRALHLDRSAEASADRLRTLTRIWQALDAASP